MEIVPDSLTEEEGVYVGLKATGVVGEVVGSLELVVKYVCHGTVQLTY